MQRRDRIFTALGLSCQEIFSRSSLQDNLGSDRLSSQYHLEDYAIYTKILYPSRIQWYCEGGLGRLFHDTMQYMRLQLQAITRLFRTIIPCNLLLEFTENGIFRILVNTRFVLDALGSVRIPQRAHTLIVVVVSWTCCTDWVNFSSISISCWAQTNWTENSTAEFRSQFCGKWDVTFLICT